MGALTDEEIISALSECTPGRLIRVLAPILAAHSARDGTQLVLCSFYTDGPVVAAGDHLLGDDSNWVVSLISPPSKPEEWSNLEQFGYSESGDCRHCGVSISSYAKEAPCPLCGSSMDLT
jgi:hypothetical protein